MVKVATISGIITGLIYSLVKAFTDTSTSLMVNNKLVTKDSKKSHLHQSNIIVTC